MVVTTQISPDSPISFGLPLINSPDQHTFVKPVKKINDQNDVQSFLSSQAYFDICTFILQLNIAMCPRKSSHGESKLWRLDTVINVSEPVKQLQELLKQCDAIIDQVPPDTGPRRFGNVSFRKWFEILESQIDGLLQRHIKSSVLGYGKGANSNVSMLEELIPYFMGSFGDKQRLDYGTGHELSFLAFLGSLWKLGAFGNEDNEDGSIARDIVIGIIEPDSYLQVIRRLILTYNLEPAGSHGVWGLDDHSFLPYILGSSQYCPAIDDKDPMPVEGSHPDAPKPSNISNKTVVDKERKINFFFGAIGFIFDVKTGPFWEHSPMLFDISGVRAGWGKINKGMIKMYNVEVLSKLPVSCAALSIWIIIQLGASFRKKRCCHFHSAVENLISLNPK
ncbi:Serine/threonine-protein phosphatase 2A activator 1 [Erysiphe neolycopersici]|uniref:Serine/threonine-protein phosphatase 2A activator n=1 Tax=Erysiphe neolycopersici TaxID=212602 RepID=A0A420HE72_9PEZI|nr:Serine/threonine-protein phosphatase 2A activator 1 [Erysiphe neolycopersici]